MRAAIRRRLWLLAAVVILVQACAPPPEKEQPDRLVLRPVSFADLPGWEADDQGTALRALKRSCDALEERADDTPLDIASLGGRVGDWRAVCAGAAGPEDAASARAFFEARFTPYEVRNNANAEGLFTGYFEPELRGALQVGGRYTVPLYARPRDLVSVDLGRFRAELAGERIAGRVAGGALEPYATRAEIDTGALAGQGLELAWVDDPVDAFFLHIQGSGRIAFEDGTHRRVAYAATNGHGYSAIGRRLVDLGALSREDVSMQTIRDWLAANPARAPEVMRENASYVFFRWLDGEQAAKGPVGAQGVTLTAGRSLAVDRRFVPMTVPIWLETDAPARDPAEADRTIRRLMVAQDTGSAIRGPVRGDVYWGTGDAAGAVAGRMKHAGRYWLLLPRGLDVAAHLD
ncbi:MAG: MltA domain-containing protein [Rhodospirillales bacterium]|nr:MltA domain-containing protein [Rhodospirillales bacterium]